MRKSNRASSYCSERSERVTELKYDKGSQRSLTHAPPKDATVMVVACDAVATRTAVSRTRRPPNSARHAELYCYGSSRSRYMGERRWCRDFARAVYGRQFRAEYARMHFNCARVPEYNARGGTAAARMQDKRDSNCRNNQRVASKCIRECAESKK